ncbi:hypothetical protein [Pelomonas sp. Root1444]|nr:hypothetical protein [Pelomonas sp. Root1444]
MIDQMIQRELEGAGLNLLGQYNRQKAGTAIYELVAWPALGRRHWR